MILKPGAVSYPVWGYFCLLISFTTALKIYEFDDVQARGQFRIRAGIVCFMDFLHNSFQKIQIHDIQARDNFVSRLG